MDTEDFQWGIQGTGSAGSDTQSKEAQRDRAGIWCAPDIG